MRFCFGRWSATPKARRKRSISEQELAHSPRWCVTRDWTLFASSPMSGSWSAFGRMGSPPFLTFRLSLPLQDPYLYTLNVLEHIENDAEALRAIFHALRPGGRCLIYVPAFPILYSSFDRRLGHFRRYRRRSLAALVRSQGFAIEEATYKDSIGFAAALVFRLVAKPDGSVSEAAISIFDRFLFPLSAELDRIMGRICGKNVLICARKPIA